MILGGYNMWCLLSCYLKLETVPKLCIWHIQTAIDLHHKKKMMTACRLKYLGGVLSIIVRLTSCSVLPIIYSSRCRVIIFLLAAHSIAQLWSNITDTGERKNSGLSGTKLHTGEDWYVDFLDSILLGKLWLWLTITEGS